MEHGQVAVIPFMRIPTATHEDDNGDQPVFRKPFSPAYQAIVDRLLEIDMENAVMVTMNSKANAHALRNTAQRWHECADTPFTDRRVIGYTRGKRVYLRLLPID